MRIAVLIIGLVLMIGLFFQSLTINVLSDVGNQEASESAGAVGIVMALMWLAEWPPAQHLSDGSPSMSTNPVVEYHVIYAAALVALALTSAGETWGLGRIWARLPFVRRNGWLR